MGFQVIEDLAVADKLAEVGLLWYSYPTFNPGEPLVWPGLTRNASSMYAAYRDYTFYILTEE